MQKSTGYLLSGHGLRAAARGGPTSTKRRGRRLDFEGVETVPVLVRDCTDDEARRWLMADNFLAKNAQDDRAGLRKLVRSIVGDAFGGDVEQAAEHGATGWSLAELAGALTDGKARAKKLEVRPPPDLTWFVVAIPTARWGEIAALTERIGNVPDLTVCEISSTTAKKP